MAKSKTLGPTEVTQWLNELFAEDMHAKRVLSLGNAVAGVLESASLSVHAIGRGLALANELEVKRAIKQVDQLLSNAKLSVWEVFRTGCGTCWPNAKKRWWRWTGRSSTRTSTQRSRCTC
jgi:hypothetical protein